VHPRRIALINTIGALADLSVPMRWGREGCDRQLHWRLLLLAALLFVSAIATLRMRTAPALAELPVRAEPAGF
jgi:hypothetical protein